jgi:TolB protein
VNADGSGQGWLTLTAAAGPRVAWSPDGRRIAFVSNRDGNSDVYVMNADGRGQRRLTRNAAPLNDPAWSPDGRKIAFVSDRDDNSEIYVMNADGSGLRNLTRDPAGDSTFAWSPDGRKIPESKWQVYVMNADGSDSTADAQRGAQLPRSPDGKQRIARERGRRQRTPCSWCPGQWGFEVYVINADGSGQQRLTRGASQPRWSPDGRTIAFVSKREETPTSSS